MATATRPGLFARKPTEHLVRETTGDDGLKRAVGVLDLTALGIGAIIGTGIFVIIGEAIADSGLEITDANRARTGLVFGAGIGGLATIEDNYGKYLETKTPKKISPFYIPASIVNMISGHLSIMYGITGPNLATGVWAMEDIVRIESNGGPIAFRGYGHYHDVYVRTAAGWRFKQSVETRLRVEADRRCVAAVGGGCLAPVAAHHDGAQLVGLVADEDGRWVERLVGDDPEVLGLELADAYRRHAA